MTFDEYQKRTGDTAAYPTVGQKYVYPTLGLVGEAGEVAEKIKKILRQEGGQISPQRKEEINKELGDVLWYLAQLAATLGLSLEDIAQTNLAKLARRQANNSIHGEGDER